MDDDENHSFVHCHVCLMATLMTLMTLMKIGLAEITFCSGEEQTYCDNQDHKSETSPVKRPPMTAGNDGTKRTEASTVLLTIIYWFYCNLLSWSFKRNDQCWTLIKNEMRHCFCAALLGSTQETISFTYADNRNSNWPVADEAKLIANERRRRRTKSLINIGDFVGVRFDTMGRRPMSCLAQTNIGEMCVLCLPKRSTCEWLLLPR